MRKWVTLLMTLLVGASVHSDASTGNVDFYAGYRNDTVEWKHDFPSSDPVIASRQKFQDLDIFQLGLQGRATVGCNIYLRADAYLGWILDGKFKESADVYGSFENDNLYGSAGFGASLTGRNVIDDQYVYGANAAIGYTFFLCDCTLALAPVIGYSIDVQDIHYDGSGLETSGCGGCCTHKFNNRWYGPFVGLDFIYNPYCEVWNIWAELEYHWGEFKGRRGFRDDFYLFDRGDRRTHNVDGWVFAIGGDYQLCSDWTVGLFFKFQDWHSRKHSRFNFDSSYGEYDFISSAYGNHAKKRHTWKSYAFNLTAGYHF